MNDSPKKTKPSLESLLADSQVQKGVQLIATQKAKGKQLKEFAKAAEFKLRHKKSRKSL